MMTDNEVLEVLALTADNWHKQVTAIVEAAAAYVLVETGQPVVTLSPARIAEHLGKFAVTRSVVGDEITIAVKKIEGTT